MTTASVQAHELFMQLKEQLVEGNPPCAPFVRDAYAGDGTPVSTRPAGGKAAWRRRPRPFLIISSTSWTPDEDFGVRRPEAFSSSSQGLPLLFAAPPSTPLSRSPGISAQPRRNRACPEAQLSPAPPGAARCPHGVAPPASCSGACMLCCMLR